MKNIFYLLLFATFMLSSCSKSEDVTNGGTFSITASSGTTKTMKLYNGTFSLNLFHYSIYNYYPNPTQQVFDISGLIDYPNSYGGTSSDCGVEFIYEPPIVINKVYTEIDGSISSVAINFKDWLVSDNSNMKKKSILFVEYNYPGHILGHVYGYDVNGHLLAHGFFDFISTKPTE